MRKIIAVIPLALGLAVIPGSANAAPKVNWEAKASADYSKWLKNHTTAELDALVSDGFRLPWKYLGEDITTLYVKVRSHDRNGVDVAEQYLGEDFGYLGCGGC